MDKKDKRKKILKVSGLVGLFLLVFGLSYALFTVTLNGTKKVKVKTGKLELQLLDENNQDITNPNNAGYVINLENQVPVDDETGLGTGAFEFKLKNNGSIDARYTIYLDDVALEVGEDRLLDSAVRYSLTKNGSADSAADLTTIGANPNRKLDEGVIKKDVTNTYTLKIWIDEEAGNEAMDKVFSTVLRVEGEQYVKTGEFDDGTAAAVLYEEGVKQEYNATEGLPNGLDSENEESGLIKYTDENGVNTYMYRGINVNNYVSFAGDTWRVLRIQEDGTIKLIRNQALDYVNTEFDYGYTETVNGVTYDYVPFYKQIDGPQYNVYTGSNIEGYLSAWYQSALSSYDDKIVTNKYCSDRYESAEDSDIKTTFFSNYDNMYGVFDRGVITGGDDIYSYIRWSPSLSCTSGDEITAKIGLITADEYIIAGGGALGNISNYLNKGYTYWTMSPMGYDSSAPFALSYVVYQNGSLTGNSVLTGGALPVITLKADTIFAGGNGEESTPYIIN